jgi:hypothetical protein
MYSSRKIPEYLINFENGDVYIGGEYYGTEIEFYTDIDNGKIEIIPSNNNLSPEDLLEEQKLRNYIKKVLNELFIKQ